MVKKNKKAIFSGLIGLTLFSPILIVGISSCSQSTTSINESEQKEFDDIKNNLLSLNLHTSWNPNASVAYFPLADKELIRIENYGNAKIYIKTKFHWDDIRIILNCLNI